MRIPFLKKKTDGQKAKESMVELQTPTVQQKRVATAEDVRDEMKSNTEHKRENGITEVIETIKGMESRVSNIKSYEEGEILKREVIDKTDKIAGKYFPHANVYSLRSDRVNNEIERFHELIEDKIDEIYGTKITMRKMQQYIPSPELHYEDDVNGKRGELEISSEYIAGLDNQGIVPAFHNAVAELIFPNGKKIEFDLNNYPKGRNKRIPTGLIRRAAEFSIKMKLPHENEDK